MVNISEFIKRTAKDTKDAKGFSESTLYLSAFLWLFSVTLSSVPRTLSLKCQQTSVAMPSMAQPTLTASSAVVLLFKISFLLPASQEEDLFHVFLFEDLEGADSTLAFKAALISQLINLRIADVKA